MMGEVYIGLRPDSIPTIIRVGLEYCWVSMIMVMLEVEIGLRPSKLLHITMVNYTWYDQGSLRMLFQGVHEKKTFKTSIKDVSYIQIKIILIILIQ